MCQMTNFRKVLGACLAVFALMGAQSCNREVAEPSAAEGKTHSGETIYKEGNVEMPVSENIVFDAADETQLKALNATVSASASAGANSRHAVDYGQEFPVICIIRSDNQADPVTYAELKVTKKADGTYKMSQDRVHLAQGSTLAPGKKWYLMVVTQNSFNKNNGELSVNATGDPENLSPSATATRVMDIPSASPWIELPMFPNGQPKWSKDWDDARKKQKLTLYAQGVLCRATLRLDDAYKAKLGNENVDLKITQLKVVSTALSFSGKFKFDKTSLPPLSQISGRPTLTWEPTQTESATKEYRALDVNTPEYQKVFNASDGVLQVSGSGSLATIFADSNNPTRVDKMNLPQGVQSIIFWAIPVKGATNRHTTLIAETGSSTSDKVLTPSHTYIYGKKHTKDAAQGSAVYFDAVYYNPYTPLDYMAEYNVKRKWPEQFVPGGLIPQGSSNVFDTEHGVNSFTFLTWEEVNQVSLSSGGRTYQAPTHAQWSSVIPYEGEAAINTTGGAKVDNASVYAEVGLLKDWTKFSSRVDTKNKIRYALALTDLGGSQKYRTAYRYAMAYGQGGRTVSTKYIKKETSKRRFSGGDRYNQVSVDNYVLTIQAVQLGAGFVGTVDDIANEDFWNNMALRKDKRTLPPNFTTYSVENPSYPPFNSWPESPTLYYLGDSQLAVFYPAPDVSKGQPMWASMDIRSGGKAYNLIHFPVRPFTKQER